MKTKMKIRHLGDQPPIYLIDNFLTARECTALINLAKKKGMKEQKIQFAINGKKQALSKKNRDVYNSYKAEFVQGENKTISKIEKQIEALTGIPAENGDNVAVACYEKGGYFKPHYDIYPGGDSWINDRIISVILYLNDVEEGGETTFPYTGIKVIPKKGTALIFYNILNMSLPQKGKAMKMPKQIKLDLNSLHHSEPVRKGEKWMAGMGLHPKKRKLEIKD